MLIREASEDDWPRIWPFFHEIVRAGETYAYPPDLTIDQAHDAWMETAPGRTFVAVDQDGDGAVLGSAKCGPNRGGPGSHVATASFMVDASRSRRGVGRALAQFVLDWARAQGYLAMQFNAVVETNTAAVALWRSVGFEVVGTVPEAFRHPREGLVGLHVMHCFL